MVNLGDPEISFFEPVSEDLGEIFEQGEPGRQIGGQGRQCDMDNVKRNQYTSRPGGILKKMGCEGGWMELPNFCSS